MTVFFYWVLKMEKYLLSKLIILLKSKKKLKNQLDAL